MRRGRPADRRATLAQLLEAFGEAEASPQALDRVQRALDHAGVRTLPRLADAAADIPVALSVGTPRRAPIGRPAALVAAALAAIVALVLAGRALGPDEQPGVTLPPETVPPSTTTTPPTTTAQAPPAGPLVALRLEPTEPGFACAIGEDRRVLFRGTLDRPRTVRAQRIRAVVTAPAYAVAHGQRQRLPGRRIVLVGATKLKVLTDGPTYCQEPR